MGKENSKINKLYLFLNAVYYCFWRFDIKTQIVINKQLRMVFYPIWLFLPEKFKVKYKKDMASQQNEIISYFYDKRNGFHITMAYSYFTITCYSYMSFISFILFGLILKFYDVFNFLIGIVLFLPPVIITQFILKNGVFKKDSYLTYFKKFEKENEQWHKKWGRITTAFCIGGILTFLAGVVAAFLIVMV